MSRLVVAGVWAALLVDALGNWAGQGRAGDWAVIVAATAGMLALSGAVAVVGAFRGRR